MTTAPQATLATVSENLHCLPGDLPVVVVRSPDGACATVALHGGHVLSWVPAGGREMLYLSPRSGFAARQAIRGGVPVIFPQFSDRGPLERHGFARVLPWELAAEEADEGSACVTLRLTDTPLTRESWPHPFALALAVRVGGDSLSLELSCRNTGAARLDFQAALHSYFRVDDLAACELSGLEGQPYWDALDKVERLQDGAIRFAHGDLDRVYARVAGPLCLSPQGRNHPAPGLVICQQGFEDVVVWNPGATRCAALADMPPDGWRHMVCVEAARIGAPVTLLPGQSWQGVQHLRSAASPNAPVQAPA